MLWGGEQRGGGGAEGTAVEVTPDPFPLGAGSAVGTRSEGTGGVLLQ